MNKSKQKVLSLFLVAVLLVALSAASAGASPAGAKSSDVVKHAKSWVGVKNVHGGNSRSGIDCSHLVYQVYSKAGAKGIYFMKVPAMKKSKYYVVTKKPTPGDLILWKKDVTYKGKKYYLAAHVGILIGGGKFVHTSSDKMKVTINSISEGPYKSGGIYYVRWAGR